MAWAKIRQWLSRLRRPRARRQRARRQRPEGPRLRLRYNPTKGLSGQTSADVINTVAVIAGLGAAPEMSGVVGLFGALGIIIGCLTLVVAGFMWWRAIMQQTLQGTLYLLALSTTAVGVFTIAANVVAIAGVFADPRDNGVVAGILGWLASLSWFVAEAVNAYDKGTLRPKTGPSNTSLAKSVLQMLGALVMSVCAVLVLWKKAAPIISPFFWLGAGVALFGTLLGIVAGLWNLARK